MHTAIYSDTLPHLLEQLINTPEMRRLAHIGMHCGCEYANFSLYRQERCPYSRLIHSVGVAAIVWNFTHSLPQAVAGLLHDIATPVFAHTIDFMNEDHMTQESTEDKTRSIIEASDAIRLLLGEHDIPIDAVSDYHKYPIADNDTPLLSADRLEYTLGNAYMVYHMERNQIKDIYADLSVATNESRASELCFRSIAIAKKFVAISLRNSRFFVSNEDRFAMQHLADLMRRAMDRGIITSADLYTTEYAVIEKLKQDADLSRRWDAYTKLTSVNAAKKQPQAQYCVKVFAKKRYIDPLVFVDGNVKRISELDADTKNAINLFLALDFDEWLYTFSVATNG